MPLLLAQSANAYARVPFFSFPDYWLETVLPFSYSNGIICFVLCVLVSVAKSSRPPGRGWHVSSLGNTSLLSVLIWWRYIGNINRNQEPIIWWAPVVVYFATMWPCMAAAYKFEFNWIPIFHNNSWVVNFELKRYQSFSCACWHI